MENLELKIGKTNNKWSTHHNQNSIGLPKNPVLSNDDHIFTMGSCFAEEIRKSLASRSFKVLPAYESVQIQSNRFLIDTLPARPHMNFYNTFTILQELQRAFGDFSQKEDDYWLVKDIVWKSGNKIAQDPYKRLTFGKTPSDLGDALKSVNRVIDDGVRQSNAFIFTFGMTEVFVNKKTNLVASQKPMYMGGGGEHETEFHQSTYHENKANIEKIVNLLQEQHGGAAKIFLSVSPVPLERTFSGQDIFIANASGKATLRAAAEEVARERDNVFYFPSFDIVNALGAKSFLPDGRHVKPEVVRYIMECFQRCHVN